MIGETSREVRQIRRTVFEGAMVVGAYLIAVISIVLPWAPRRAFSRLLMNTVDRVLSNRVVLELAVNVRWK